MIARVLPREEWDRLSVNGLVPIFPDFRDEDSKPVVVEKDGEIVASCVVVRTVHLESLWVKPGSGAGTIRNLMRKTTETARRWGRLAFAQSCRENVRDILNRLGCKKLSVETYLLPLEAEQ